MMMCVICRWRLYVPKAYVYGPWGFHGKQAEVAQQGLQYPGRSEDGGFDIYKSQLPGGKFVLGFESSGWEDTLLYHKIHRSSSDIGAAARSAERCVIVSC